MPVTLVVGGQWGDEGKAKIIDYLARDSDYVVRYAGGANAGHTVVVDGARFAFHLVPSGILYPHATCVLGGGMVIDPIALANEIDGVKKKGIDVDGRIFVSDQAHVVFPYHIEMDAGTETRLGSSSIGTTRRGIAPAYVDKVGRKGVRMGDLLRPRAEVEQLFSKKFREKNKELKSLGLETLPVQESVERLLRARKKIQPLITDTRVILWSALEQKRKILCEGAQGTLLDVDHGTYPYVTSSSSSAGGAVAGAGLPPSSLERVIGIFKAYCTRVGNGPFPTEDKRRMGDKLRELGGEYGTTTGRPRRCGWFDAVAARTVVKLNGITEVAITKLDVLDSFDEIKICTSYRCGRRRLDYFPTNVRSLERCKPEYEVVKGWKKKTNSGGKPRLPRKAAAYVRYLEKLMGCRVHLVSLGPDRKAMVKLS
ncbi:MAG: adenylosuccinate synthase [Candidatus Latescibacterota bacterium]|nr:MAG: adenylosuccinate synthase [Candidatus Latescibacterota bacterium]